nr:hypothetical protein [Tanacetum cinerariifolium]
MFSEESGEIERSQAANPNYNNNNNNRRATVAYQGVHTCFECGAQGHYKRNCQRLGNKFQGNQNQTGNGNAVDRAYGLGTAGGNPNVNVVTGESKPDWEWKCGGKSIWTGYCRRKPKRQCRDG